MPHLLAIARQAEPLRYHALAVAGLARLGGALPGQPPDLALLAETLKLARRPEEKQQVLGVLGGIAAPEALALVLPQIDDAEVVDEASAAALGIVEQLPKLEAARRRAMAEKILAHSQSPALRAGPRRWRRGQGLGISLAGGLAQCENTQRASPPAKLRVENLVTAGEKTDTAPRRPEAVGTATARPSRRFQGSSGENHGSWHRRYMFCSLECGDLSPL